MSFFDAHARRLSARDLDALAFIGEGYEVTQYQLQEAVFRGLSPTVASRFVCRAVGRKLIAAERLNQVGMNRLRLTESGRDLLIGTGGNPLRLFAPRRPVALKDLAHTLRINDLRVVLGSHENVPAQLLPAWTLQRLQAAEVVPDLIAVWRKTAGRRPSTLACEVDLNTENLSRVFLPKVQLLRESLSCVQNAAILILTTGYRRADLLRDFAESQRGHVPIVVELLPRAFGARGLEELRKLLTD